MLSDYLLLSEFYRLGLRLIEVAVVGTDRLLVALIELFDEISLAVSAVDCFRGVKDLSFDSCCDLLVSLVEEKDGDTALLLLIV